MKQHINVQGMTCLNCQKSVTEKLAAIEGVEAVSVSFEEASAHFETPTLLPLHQIANQLGAKYSVSDPSGSNAASNATQKTLSKWKALTPLWLIFGYLVAATAFLQLLTQNPQRIMLDFMGLFFIVFSFFKFLDYKGFPASFAKYDPLAKKSRLYGKLYPFVETVLGVLFLLQKEVLVALLLTVFLLSMTTYGVLQSLLNKNQIECACLGTALKLPMTEATLIENLVMITMALINLSGLFI
jgi:copper chaperone CopZ